jgi:hypothetical protein
MCIDRFAYRLQNKNYRLQETDLQSEDAVGAKQAAKGDV